MSLNSLKIVKLLCGKSAALKSSLSRSLVTSSVLRSKFEEYKPEDKIYIDIDNNNFTSNLPTLVEKFRSQNIPESQWLELYKQDFRERFLEKKYDEISKVNKTLAEFFKRVCMTDELVNCEKSIKIIEHFTVGIIVAVNKKKEGEDDLSAINQNFKVFSEGLRRAIREEAKNELESKYNKDKHQHVIHILDGMEESVARLCWGDRYLENMLNNAIQKLVNITNHDIMIQILNNFYTHLNETHDDIVVDDGNHITLTIFPFLLEDHSDEDTIARAAPEKSEIIFSMTSFIKGRSIDKEDCEFYRPRNNVMQHSSIREYFVNRTTPHNLIMLLLTDSPSLNVQLNKKYDALEHETRNLSKAEVMSVCAVSQFEGERGPLSKHHAVNTPLLNLVQIFDIFKKPPVDATKHITFGIFVSEKDILRLIVNINSLKTMSINSQEQHALMGICYYEVFALSVLKKIADTFSIRINNMKNDIQAEYLSCVDKYCVGKKI